MRLRTWRSSSSTRATSWASLGLNPSDTGASLTCRAVGPAEADFVRATRSAAAADMPPDFRTALDKRAELHGLEDLPLDSARAAGVTVSAPRSRGFLRRRREHTTWIGLMPEVLVVVGGWRPSRSARRWWPTRAST